MPHLWLIGMMGSGKTAAGNRISTILGISFVDTDAMVAARRGRTVAQIFESEGEPAFRSYESAAVREAAHGPPSVIATGGGVVLFTENVETMRASGVVLHLMAAPHTLARRIGNDLERPLLATGDSHSVLTDLMAQRRTLYDRARHATIDTDDLTLDQVARRAISLWNEYSSATNQRS